MSTPLDGSSLPGADAISSPPMGTNAPSTPPRDLHTLLTNALAHYPVIQLLATHLHDVDLVNLMLTSRAIYYTIAPSRTAIKKFTCGGVSPWRFGCWCCGTQVCSVCLTSPCPTSAIPTNHKRSSQCCCYDVFLPGITPPGTCWPTEDDKLHNDKSIRHPASDYQFSDAKRCCFECWRIKPAWWIKEKYQERARRDGYFLQKGECQ